MGPLLFLLLPALAASHITITIEASNSSTTSSVHARGSDVSIISDNERTTFGVSDNVLKIAAEKYSGGKPQDVFLHSPTPWNDLYQTYGWKPVQRTLKPSKSRVLDVQSETVVVSLKELDNNSSASMKFNASLKADAENFVKHKWSKSGSFDIKDPIFYIANGGVAFSISSPWGIDSIESKKVEIVSKANVEVDLKPGEKVRAALIATKVTMTIQIDYAANLSGHVACNYPKKYNGHHFWRYDISELMMAGGLVRNINSYEVVSVQFYNDASIVVTDKLTKATISEVPAVVRSNYFSTD